MGGFETIPPLAMMPRITSKALLAEFTCRDDVRSANKKLLFGSRTSRKQVGPVARGCFEAIPEIPELHKYVDMPKMPLLSSKFGSSVQWDAEMMTQTLMPRPSSKALLASALRRSSCARWARLVPSYGFRVLCAFIVAMQWLRVMVFWASAHFATWLRSESVPEDSGSRVPDSFVRTPVLPQFSTLVPSLGAGSNDPWCLPVLRTEARLRLGADYIGQTQLYFDAGQPPPPSLDEHVEKEALRLHGHFPSESQLSAYRAAARALSAEQRAGFFFLRANDQLYRPDALLVGRHLKGSFYEIGQIHEGKLDRPCSSLEAVFETLSRVILVASTSS